MNWGGLKKKNRAPRETNSSPRSFKKRFAPMLIAAAIIKSPACLTLFLLWTYNLYFIASKLITVADMRVI